jgi:hypothetical protein
MWTCSWPCIVKLAKDLPEGFVCALAVSFDPGYRMLVSPENNMCRDCAFLVLAKSTGVDMEISVARSVPAPLVSIDIPGSRTDDLFPERHSPEVRKRTARVC